MECERFLRVVAYVCKDDDAIPEYKSGALRTISGKCAPLLLNSVA